MERFQTIFLNFDTVNIITIYHRDARPLAAARRYCAHCESLFSRFLSGSDLWRIDHAGGRPVTVAPETAELISLAMTYAAETSGAFDITIGALTSLWDLSGQAPPPNFQQLRENIGRVDSSQIAIDGQTVQLPAGMSLDLGGIAKGYIADGIIRLLRIYEVTSAIVDLCGNIYVLGRRPDGERWRVGIRSPQAGPSPCAAVLALEDTSVVTSGIYERGYDRDGRRFHHILDPKTGLPAENDLASVSVIYDQSVAADAFSTALLCVGSARAMEMLRCLPALQVFFQKRDGSTLWWYGASVDLGQIRSGQRPPQP